MMGFYQEFKKLIYLFILILILVFILGVLMSLAVPKLWIIVKPIIHQLTM